jgi:hypothetical protein
MGADSARRSALVVECKRLLDSGEGMDAVQGLLSDREVGVLESVIVTRELLGGGPGTLIEAKGIVVSSPSRSTERRRYEPLVPPAIAGGWGQEPQPGLAVAVTIDHCSTVDQLCTAVAALSHPTTSDFGACLRRLRNLINPEPTYASLARAALGDACKITTVRNWLLGSHLPNAWEPLHQLISYLLDRIPEGDNATKAALMEGLHRAFECLADLRTVGRQARVRRADPRKDERAPAGDRHVVTERGSYTISASTGGIYGGSGAYYGGCGY